jgi:hypothetical protein
MRVRGGIGRAGEGEKERKNEEIVLFLKLAPSETATKDTKVAVLKIKYKLRHF